MNTAHVHLIVNHAPLFGLVAALLLLAWGVLRNSPEVRFASYVAFLLSGIAAIVAYMTGGAAESLVEDLPGITGAAIERHQDVAALAVLVIGFSAGAAVAAFVTEKAGATLRRATLTVLFVIGIAALGTVAYAANLGGQIHHTEITGHK
jgi:hypothetical protein